MGSHEEGCIAYSSPTGGGQVGVYEYNYTDHLGNLRLSFRDSLTAGAPPVITQQNHYSPFGLSLQGLDFQNVTPDNFKYSQNEQQSDFGLNLYDFGARFSDPTIGNRFWQQDPLAEISRRFSPYLYANANPMRFIDPDGLSAQDVDTYTLSDGTTVSVSIPFSGNQYMKEELCRITFKDGDGIFILINGHKRKCAFNGFFAVFFVHLFYVYFYRHLHTRTTYVMNEADQLNDGAVRNCFLEIDLVGRNRYETLTTEPRCCNKSHFVHPLHGRAAE